MSINYDTDEEKYAASAAGYESEPDCEFEMKIAEFDRKEEISRWNIMLENRDFYIMVFRENQIFKKKIYRELCFLEENERFSIIKEERNYFEEMKDLYEWEFPDIEEIRLGEIVHISNLKDGSVLVSDDTEAYLHDVNSIIVDLQYERERLRKGSYMTKIKKIISCMC